jgi:hypothetical protein
LTLNGIEGYSEDRLWLWEADGDTHTTHIVRADGKIEWFVPIPPEIIGKFSRKVFAYYKPVFNLPDQSYYYLVGYFCCWSAFPLMDNPGNTLARVDLRTGQLSVVISDDDMNNFYFSPTGKFLAYIPTGLTFKPLNMLQIVRLFDGQHKIISLPDGSFYGKIVWSPDSNQVIVQSCYLKPANGDPCNPRSLFIVDIEKSNYQILIPDIEKSLNQNVDDAVQIEWLSAKQVRIKVGNQSGAPLWLLDLETGTITVAGL